MLNYLEEEGLSIEPQWYEIHPMCSLSRRCDDRYCPILPMVLVNGAEGIGVGWSTSIPNYNPRDIIRWAVGAICLLLHLLCSQV